MLPADFSMVSMKSSYPPPFSITTSAFDSESVLRVGLVRVRVLVGSEIIAVTSALSPAICLTMSAYTLVDATTCTPGRDARGRLDGRRRSR